MPVTAEEYFASVPETPLVLPPDAKFYRRRDEILPYFPMSMIPSFIAVGIYLGFTDGYAIRPPSLKALRPRVPTFEELPPMSGFFAATSPYRVLWPNYLGYLLIWVLLLVAQFVIAPMVPSWARWIAVAVLVIAALLLISRAYFIFLKWACEGLAITNGALYALKGIYSATSRSIQGNDIDDVDFDYAWPKPFWKWSRIGTLLISYGKQQGNSSSEQFRHIGNVEAVATLVRGLQRAQEQATIKQASTIEMLYKEAIRGNELQDDGNALLAEIRDLLKTPKPVNVSPITASIPVIEQPDASESTTPLPEHMSGEDDGEDQPDNRP